MEIELPKNYMSMNIYSLLDFFYKKKRKKILKIRNKGNRKIIIHLLEF